MTTISKLSEEEYQALCELHAAMHKVSHLNVTTFFEDLDSITMSQMDDLVYDIGNNPLIQCINKYKAGETTVTAMDTEYIGFSIVEVKYEPVDAIIFGFKTEGDEVIYHLCQTYLEWNEETEETETFFDVDEQVIKLTNCLRTPATAVKPDATTYELLEILNKTIYTYNNLKLDTHEHIGWWDIIDKIDHSDKVALGSAIKEIETKIRIVLAFEN